MKHRHVERYEVLELIGMFRLYEARRRLPTRSRCMDEAFGRSDWYVTAPSQASDDRTH